jgi:chromosome segregation ATPase
MLLRKFTLAVEREGGRYARKSKTFSKMREDAMKKEYHEGWKEVEQMRISEASAKRRTEEIEAALRESTTALENAQAELEGLRAECVVAVSFLVPAP